MRKLRFFEVVGIVFALCITATLTARGQTLTTLLTFNGPNGGIPEPLVVGTNGNLFGATHYYGAHSDGTLFEITTTGTLIAQYSFDGFNPGSGEFPNGELVEAANHNFYGTTSNGGGSRGGGTVFKLAGGQVTTLYSFCSQTNCTDGLYPYAGLLEVGNGNFFGTTHQGGANPNCNGFINGCGTIFEVSAEGKLITLYSFCSLKNCADGYYPFGGLVQGGDGAFYGTTSYGGNTGCGSSGCGTIFKITAAGKLTTLYRFCSQANCTDGVSPASGLVHGSDGNFYGTTLAGGLEDNCVVNNLGCGTIFKITPSGQFTTLYQFCSLTNCSDGGASQTPLMQGTDGNLYGTTAFGGANDVGVVFQITTSGAFTTLYSFCSQANCADGATPETGLVEANGVLYGTTSGDFGHEGYGTVFSLTLK